MIWSFYEEQYPSTAEEAEAYLKHELYQPKPPRRIEGNHGRQSNEYGDGRLFYYDPNDIGL